MVSNYLNNKVKNGWSSQFWDGFNKLYLCEQLAHKSPQLFLGVHRGAVQRTLQLLQLLRVAAEDQPSHGAGAEPEGEENESPKVLYSYNKYQIIIYKLLQWFQQCPLQLLQLLIATIANDNNRCNCCNNSWVILPLQLLQQLQQLLQHENMKNGFLTIVKLNIFLDLVTWPKWRCDADFLQCIPRKGSAIAPIWCPLLNNSKDFLMLTVVSSPFLAEKTMQTSSSKVFLNVGKLHVNTRDK